MHKFMTKYIVLLTAFAALFFLTSTIILPLAAGSEDSGDHGGGNRYAVQVILKARAAPPDFWRIVEMGIQMATDEYGVSCEVSGPTEENNIQEQIRLVRKAIDKKPDAIILAAGDYNLLAPVCLEVQKAGIKLILVDSDVNFAGKECFVGTDNYELGQKLGMLVNETLPKNEKYGVIGHVQTSFTAIERIRGFMDSVGYDDTRFAGLEYCDGLKEEAVRLTMQLLEQNPDITCMIGLNETSALGICDALEVLGLSEQVRVFSCDSSEAQIKRMENGMIQAVVIQNPFNMGYLSMQAAVQAIEGRKLESFLNTGSVTITKEDMYRPENQKLLFPFTDKEQQ